MNRNLRSSTSRTYANGFLVGLLTIAFLITSERPLLASPSEESPSNSNQSSSSHISSSQPSSGENGSNQAGGGQASSSQKPEDSLPDAPQATPQAQTAQQEPAPSGTAGAKAANVKGAPVAQPAGAAVAPARQRGHRSLFIKLGLLAGAGIAVGTVVALSAKSQARPPGASPALQP
jgi:hypothetical protein